MFLAFLDWKVHDWAVIMQMRVLPNVERANDGHTKKRHAPAHSAPNPCPLRDNLRIGAFMPEAFTSWAKWATTNITSLPTLCRI